MNPESLQEAKKIFSKIKRLSSKVKGELIICPPDIYLSVLIASYNGKKISFGTQDAFWENKGSYTSHVGPGMIKSTGAEYVIIGHSERRFVDNETADTISKKVLSAVTAGLTVILCIGEKHRDQNAEYLTILKEELRQCLKRIDKRMMAKIIIAYEPIWAVGARNAMLPADIHGMTIYLRKILTEFYDKQIADNTPILYGGAVNTENVHDIIKDGEIEGLLVGRESLNPEGIIHIVQVANGK